MKIPIDTAFWAQPIQAGGDFAKSLGTNPQRGVKLFYVGDGVLVEHEGKPDRLVPIGSVLVMESRGGFDDSGMPVPESATVTVPITSEARGEIEAMNMHVKALAESGRPLAITPKRGRPPKGQP